MQQRLITACLTILFSTPTFANSNLCQTLKNHWQGEWENEHHQVIPANIEIIQVKNNKFQGRFTLEDGGEGTVIGICDSLKRNEAILYLKKDAPYFNPCRGALLVENRDYLLHFYCFNPNQSGYFKLSST